MPRISRRKFVKVGIGAAAAATAATVAYKTQKKPTPPPPEDWNAGDIAHIIPTANHRRFRIKVSFRTKPKAEPYLQSGDTLVKGKQTDSQGLCYSFDINRLQPDTEYILSITDAKGSPYCDPWPLKTFPGPDETPNSFRLLAYTCAGGPDHLYNFGFFNAYLPTELRQRLLARALSFSPDAVIANGDHVYWDLKSSAFMGNSLRAKWVAGLFDPEQPVIGTANENVLKKAFGPQIVDLYGVRFRSTPMFFLQDDHDYGENDEADDKLRTFPADNFMLDLARTTQQMYYPEMLPSFDQLEKELPDSYLNNDGVYENFGAIRYGKLFEGLLYDCRRFLTNELDQKLGHNNSLFVPEDVENWLIERTLSSEAAFLAHMPSTPILWTAGKWAEWYPDYKNEQGKLGIEIKKPYWPNGWLQQHDRLLDACVENTQRIPLFISGDLHATGTGRILGNQNKDYRANPVYSVLTGALGTGALGWPSKMRGTKPEPSVLLDVEEWQEPIEENGFTLLDFSEEKLVISHFKWLPEDGEEAIDTLEPFSTITLPRRSI